MQVARPRVVPQAAPQREHVVQWRAGERFHVRETREEALVVRDDRRDLGLLQHHFREPDAIRIAGTLPRQVPAPVPGLPADEPAGKGAHRLIRPLRKSLPCSLSFSSAFPACSFTTFLTKALKSGWNFGASSAPSIFTGSVLPFRSARSLPPWPVDE